MSETIGIIGGTGVTQFEGIDWQTTEQVPGEYGLASAAAMRARVGSRDVVFLPRHGVPHRIPPHAVNYRANIDQLSRLGVGQIVALNAVGGIHPDLQPGDLVLPDQLIDYTWGREHTFDEGFRGDLMHIDFTEPYTQSLRDALLQAAQEEGITLRDGGTHGVTQGPRLETAAEIRRMANDGCDVVGMTGMPEAALAREAGMDYAAVCMVVNPAAGLSDEIIELADIQAVLAREVAVVRRLLLRLLSTP